MSIYCLLSMAETSGQRRMSPHPNPTQVTFGKFGDDVRATELAAFLEAKVGLVLRCKIKKTNGISPHAFVHFESPKVACEAIRRSDKKRLFFRQRDLVARMDDRAWLSGRRGINATVYSHIQLTDVTVELGSIVGPESFLLSWRSEKGPLFRIEPAGKRLRLFFTHFLHLTNEAKKTKCDVMLEVRLQEVNVVREIEREVNLSLVFQLSSPPSIFYRTAEDDIYEFERDPSQLADDEDPWIRCLDIITPDQSIGRCLDYRLTVSPRHRTAFMKVVAFFKTHNLLQKSVQAQYKVSEEEYPPNSNNWNSGDGHFFSVPHQRHLDFDVMLLVNCLVHRGIMHASNLTPAFYTLLKPNDIVPLEMVKFALKHLLTSKGPVFNPEEVLKGVIEWLLQDVKLMKEKALGEDNMIVRRIIITPTRAICQLPEVERSNRVLRHFKRYKDRFLRVSFLDEDLQSIPSSSLISHPAQIIRMLGSLVSYPKTNLYHRIVNIMRYGFRLCGREYHFLAFSNGQLRDASAWFYSSDGYINVKQIREWMGTFPSKNVAKHAARMGQCFSATFDTMEVPSSEVFEERDILRGGYDFSDGIGKISPEFAHRVANILKVSDNPPSAYQIRYAGYKGVVAVWSITNPENSAKEYKLALRSSMKKFESQHRQLEIVGWSGFQPSYLNRQIITLLSTLGVPDDVFISLQEMMVHNLNRMVADRDLAYSVLRVSSDGEEYGVALRMLCAGFDPVTEAHLKSMLVAIRAGQLEELVQRTRIFVPKGRWLMGCLDESATLEYGQCFVRVTDPEDRTTSRVVTGTIIMTKNPCMHPGDIRVLEAVDVPDLYHLVDCLVVPQNGPRPHPNEASGSDLDGDVYFVSWDENLIPPSRTSAESMEYVTEVAQERKGGVQIQDVVEFFAQHMVNDSLGKISNAHVVWADKSPKGAMDEGCLELAKLAAQAVDYPKTGKPAIMPYYLKPKEYPDFMEKEKGATYESKKAIGRLYRLVKGILPTEGGVLQLEDGGSGEYGIPETAYDPDLEAPGFEKYLDQAWATKQAYDQRLLAIMTQFNIAHEGEVVTGHVIGASKMNSRRQGDVKERVSYSYRALRKEYGMHISPYNSAGEQTQNCDDFHGMVADEDLQAKASAWYHVTYHPDWRKKKQCLSPRERLFLSFPWVAVDLLIAIKNMHQFSADS